MTEQNIVPNGLKLEGSTVSIDGGKTEQTLAQWALDIQNNTSQMAVISQTASNVEKIVQDVKQQVNGLNLDKYYSRDNAFLPFYTTALDPYGNWISNRANQWESLQMYFGYQLNPDNNVVNDQLCTQMEFNYSLNNKNTGQYITYYDLVWNNKGDAFYSYGGKCFHPQTSGSASLGTTGGEWANIYSQTAVQVTSDKNFKTVVTSFDGNEDEENQKLLKALYGINGVSYKLNDAIQAKGTDKARLHTGFVAQDVEKAIKDAGLNPSDYAMWTQDVLSETISVDSGRKDTSGQPIMNRETVAVKDKDGNQVYKQSLRYEELFSALFAAHKQEIESHKQEIAVLKQEIANLKTKIGI